MSASTCSTGGNADPYRANETLHSLHSERIKQVITKLEEQDCPGAREVQILEIAGAFVHLFQRWRLVNFPHDSLAHVTIDRQAGWVIPGAGGRLPTTVSHERASLLVIADGRYASAQSVYSGWVETPDGLAIPEVRLLPLEEARQDIDLERVYQGMSAYLNQDSPKPGTPGSHSE